MSQLEAEVLILTINALGAGLLMFISGVLQKIMNQLEELEFKRFVNLLDHTAMADPFAVTVATLPILAAIGYFIAFGFNHWWFIAGIAVWAIGSAMTKVVNMPIYQWLTDSNNTDPEEIRQQRRKLEFGNRIRAWTTLGSVILMACQFGVVDVVLTLVVAAILAVPFLWLARKYIPGSAHAVAV
jgi:hypothetical protein